ncbi:tabersonine 16-hydroxylase 1-like [Coffea eugenioides]|uniref:tabersonine 16-hydroxylase 1-like n=1 Tax=Coffea eugenioides TaxID=49369 RepID=UPI000F60BA40|nr:tabersonine 16-hydroxylase 1-like [Coffea eugenioides]
MAVNLLLLAFLLFCFMVLKILKRPSGKNSRLNLPPGPNPLPIIGNIHQLFGSPNPLYHLLRDLAKEYGPLMHLKLGETSNIIVTSAEMAREIYKTHDITFASRPSHHPAFKIVSYNFADIMFSPYGKYWRELRKICNMELLSAKSVQSFRSIREDEVFDVIKSISSQKGSIMNLTRSIFSLTYSITSRSAFGKRNEDTEEFIQLLDETNGLATGFSLADMYPSVKLFQVMAPMRFKLEKAHKESDKILENILNEHKGNSKEAIQGGGECKEDLVDVLVNIQKRGDFEPQLTDTNIKAIMLCGSFVEVYNTSLEVYNPSFSPSPSSLERKYPLPSTNLARSGVFVREKSSWWVYSKLRNGSAQHGSAETAGSPLDSYTLADATRK